MKSLRVLILGAGGREVALARDFAQSPLLESLFIAPGNAGTAEYGTNINVDVHDNKSVVETCQQNEIDLLVVGPEAPLVHGVADAVRCQCPKTSVFGPGADGAKLEGSKAFAKDFMRFYGIPTSPYMVVNKKNEVRGVGYINASPMPIVIKADGLCGGKGVVVAKDRDQAKDALHKMLYGEFGEASETVVVEQFIDGKECSVFVMTDGESFTILPVARDYKRAYDGDNGSNTGGMGAVSPVSYADKAFMDKVVKHIIAPTLKALKDKDILYRGVIYLGLVEKDGQPYVLEYNVRFGDPETSVVLARTGGDILRACYSVARGCAHEVCLKALPDVAVAVVVATTDYPGRVKKGAEVVVDKESRADTTVLLGGASVDADGKAIVVSGRVATIVATGQTIVEARKKAYAAVKNVAFTNARYRTDIATS